MGSGARFAVAECPSHHYPEKGRRLGKKDTSVPPATEFHFAPMVTVTSAGNNITSVQLVKYENSC